MLFFFFRLSACQDYRLDVEVWKVIFAFQRCGCEPERGGPEQAFEVDQKVSVWGKLMGKPKTRGGGQSFQNCQAK